MTNPGTPEPRNLGTSEPRNPGTSFWLSFHAPYACRDSGACCSSGWDIAIEKPRVPAIDDAVASGRIAAPARWFNRADGAPDDVAGVLALGPERHCVFHGSRCAIHSALGHAAMPAACQHFPRVVLIDARGVFVTLSHYCPSAAALLIGSEGPTTIVEGPPALPGGAPPEGLDARGALPPLRSPRLLMDLDEYSAWERATVHALTASDDPASVVQALLDRDPGMTDDDLYALARACVPAPVEPPASPAPARSQPVAMSASQLGRFLAAHAFACWMAYQGNGLAATALHLRLSLAVLRVELSRQSSLLDAVRQADLLLRHLIDREVLAARISAVCGPARPRPGARLLQKTPL